MKVQNNENFEHCASIANTLEAYAENNAYKCPHCDTVHTFEEYEITEHENEEGEIFYTCPHCGEDIEENELEALSMYDYFDDIFDIEYRVGSDKQYRSVRLMVACGGPNIYIDTHEKAVILYWWNETARCELSSSACSAIDEYFEELFNC